MRHESTHRRLFDRQTTFIQRIYAYANDCLIRVTVSTAAERGGQQSLLSRRPTRAAQGCIRSPDWCSATACDRPTAGADQQGPAASKSSITGGGVNSSKPERVGHDPDHGQRVRCQVGEERVRQPVHFGRRVAFVFSGLATDVGFHRERKPGPRRRCAGACCPIDELAVAHG